MHDDKHLSLHTDSLFRSLLELCKKYRYPLLSSLFFGFLSYTFLFTNKLPNHDDLASLFNVGATFISGRWALALFSWFIPHISTPWFHGVVTMLLISTACCILVSAFQIQNHLIQSLMAGVIIAFPSLLSTLGYMFTAPYYAISFLLATLAVWFVSRDRRSGFLLAVVCGTLSLGIYQAYIGIISSLLVTLLLQKVLYSDVPPRKIFQKGMQFLLLLATILLFYSGITFLTQSFANIEMGTYASDALDISLPILDRILLCYQSFGEILLDSSLRLLPAHGLRELNLILLVIVVVELLLCGLRRSRRGYLPLLALLALLYPASVTCIYLFVDANSVHALVMYSFAMVYVLAAVVLDGGIRIVSGKVLLDRCRALCMDAALLAMSLLLVGNCMRSNAASLNLFFNYENNYALATSIITQMQMTPGYDPETPVALFGDLPNSYHPALAPLHDVHALTGMSGISTAAYSYQDFWECYLGTHVPFAGYSDKQALLETEEFQQMPTYPSEGYIQMIGDFIVVKLPA